MDFTGEETKTHIAILPLCWAIGHFLPLSEFAERLCKFDGFSVTFIISKWRWGSQQPKLVKRLASSGLDIRFKELPDFILVDDEQNHAFQKFSLQAKPHIEELLLSLHSSSSISAFVTDMFCTELLDVSARLSIPSYIFSPSSASFVCYMLHLPKLLSEIGDSLKDVDYEIEIPGLPLISTGDLPIIRLDSSNPALKWFVNHACKFREASGILINTFAELEDEAMKSLSTSGAPSVYSIGPLMFSDSDAQDESKCLEWLDHQPLSSVLFVAFGSRAVLSKEQITDLAMGLEASGHRFLWVLPGYQSGDSSSPETDISQVLPKGFESRTSGRGMVVRNWVPQIQVLSHPSVGGFLSHCGWNSTLESVYHGVPMIAWPQAAEQKMNKVILVKQIEVAIDLRMEREGFVRREEVEKAVRELMEGEGGRKAREKMKEMENKAKMALMEGGSTMKAIAKAATNFSHKLSFNL